MQSNADKLFHKLLGPQYNPAWLGSMRKDAYDRFLSLGLPRRNNEDWLYTSSKPLDFEYEPSCQSTGFHSHTEALAPYLLQSAWVLVFVDGCFAEELSKLPHHPDIQCTVLNHDFSSTVKGGRDRIARTEFWSQNSLEQLNLALFQTGAHISISRDSKVESVLQIIHLGTAQAKQQPAIPRILVDLAPYSELILLETFIGQDDGHWTNATLDVKLDSHSKLHIAQEKVLADKSLLTQRTYVTLEEGAEFNYFQLAMGGRLNRNEVVAQLNGHFAKARIDGLSLGRGSAHLDHNTVVIHKAPHSNSEQIYKALLDDNSQSVFDGKIEIVKHAQQVQAQQLSKALLLSENASAHAKPQLKIDADDVRCSHGATVGQLNAQEVFYLQSRGISRIEAESILSKAFIRDVLGRIQTKSLNEHVSQCLSSHANLEI